MKKYIAFYWKAIKNLSHTEWLLICIIFVVAIYFGISSLNKNKWITITFKVQTPPDSMMYYGGTAPFWITDKIKVGDEQFDNLGQPNLKIMHIKSWGFSTKEMWVTASIKAKYKAAQNAYTFMYQPLEIGRAIDVNINGTNIHGLVTEIQGTADPRKTYEVIVKTRLQDNTSPYAAFSRGIDPWIANSIVVGQAMKDEKGKEVATILEKNAIPAERVVTTADGQVLLGKDPLKIDVFLTIRLTVTRENDVYLFLEDKPIKIGFNFPLFLEETIISPVILSIEKPNPS